MDKLKQWANLCCAVCGADERHVKVTSGSEWFTYYGQSVRVDNYIVSTCDVCGEGIVERESRRRSEKICKEHIDYVNKNLQYYDGFNSAM